MEKDTTFDEKCLEEIMGYVKGGFSKEAVVTKMEDRFPKDTIETVYDSMMKIYNVAQKNNQYNNKMVRFNNQNVDDNSQQQEESMQLERGILIEKAKSKCIQRIVIGSIAFGAGSLISLATYASASSGGGSYFIFFWCHYNGSFLCYQRNGGSGKSKTN